jgi:hypothetical protein
MILYFAATSALVGETYHHDAGMRSHLVSFAEKGKQNAKFWALDHQTLSNRIFLDSGAFSAHTQGISIDIKAYYAFITQHPEVTAYASLDVIRDWQASAENYSIMKAEGLDPIPTFHRGSPMSELRRIASEASYIALGGVVSDHPTEASLRPWFDECWQILKEFWPIKVHVFGVSAQWCLERYPWHSADSSIAIVSAGHGWVTTFDGKIHMENWRPYSERTGDMSVVPEQSTVKTNKVRPDCAGRQIRNIEAMLQLEAHVTKLWSTKSIDWAQFTSTPSLFED